MTVSISLAVIHLWNLHIWSWFNFGRWYLSRKLSISFKFSNFVEYKFLKYDLMILCISSMFVLMSSFSFLISLICIFSLCLLVKMDKGWSILLIFSKNLLFVSLILSIVFFVSILLISALNLIIYCHLDLLGEISSFFPNFSNVLLIP